MKVMCHVKNRFNDRAKRGPRTGFTLIELLVSLAIVGLLTALLVPYAHRAMMKAKQTKSMGNLKTIHTALNCYLAENDNTFPFECGPGFKNPFWSEQLGPYLYNSTVIYNVKGVAGTKARLNAAFIDPLLASNRHHDLGDYGCNTALMVGPTSTPVRAASIARASGVLLAMTAGENSGGTPIGSWYVDASSIQYGLVSVDNAPAGASYPSSRNIGTVLGLFVDGHTEAIAKDDFNANKKQLFLPNP